MTSNESPKENLSTELTNAPSIKEKNTLIQKNTLFTVIICILLASLAVASFLWIMSQYKRLQENQITLNQQITQLNQEYNALKEVHLVILNKYSQKEDDRWMLTKAHQYLQLANIEAHWNGAPDTIITLIQQTDATLSEVTQHNVVEIRKALDQALIQLKSIPKIDIEGMLSQLDAIQIQVGELKSKPLIPSFVSETKKAKPETQPTSIWRDGLQNSIDALKKLVVVRSQDETTTPILSALHIKIIQENIRFNLQEAELALLMQNEKIYSMALDKAIHQIQNTFDPDNQSVKSLTQQLEQLKATQFIKPTIRLESPLKLLKQIMKEQKGTTP